MKEKEIRRARRMMKNLTRERKRKVRRDFEKRGEVLCPEGLDRIPDVPSFDFEEWLEFHREMVAKKDE